MRSSPACPLALTILLIFGAGQASAEETDFDTAFRDTRLTLQLDVWPTRQAQFETMDLTGQISLGRHFAFDMDVAGFVGTANPNAGAPLDSGQAQTVADFGNVTAGGHGIFSLGPNVALMSGVTLSIPTRWNTSFSPGTCAPGQCTLVFDGVAASSRGDYDLQRLLPETVFLRLPNGLEVRAGHFRYRAELNLQLLIPSSASGTQAMAMLVEHADEFELRSTRGWGGGVRLQAAFGVFQVPFEAATDALFAAEPFVGYEPPGRGFFGRVGVLCGINPPLGFGFSGTLVSVRLRVGYKF